MSKIELFHSSRTFQDRRRPSVAGIDRKSRLYLQNRFKGCIRSSSYARRIQGLPKFRKRRGSIPLQVPGVWPKRSSKNFFQNNEVCNRTAQERRDSGNLLSERHLHPSQDEGRNESIDNQGETSFRKAWLHYQLQEEHPHPIKDSGIFRISVQQQDHDHFSNRVEDYKFNEENPSGGDDSNEDMQMDSRFIGEDDVNDTSSRRSSIKYQVFTEGSIEDITPDTPKLGDNLQIVNTSLQESSWWEMFLTQKNGLPIQKITAANSKTTIHVDVSNSGWGVSSDMITASGFWNQEGEQKSIHVRELKTILFALQHHAPKCGNSIIKIYSDNITAKSGGTTTIILQDLAIQIQELCNQYNIHVMYQHIPGILNTQADQLSRRKNPLYESTFPKKMFNQIQQQWGPLKIDAFAARHNNQLPTYWSLTPDPIAAAMDAMRQTWLPKGMYLYPPWKLIPQVLKKIHEQRLKQAVLVTSWWSSQFWFPMILRMKHMQHPIIWKINQKWSLAAWRLLTASGYRMA